MLTPHIARLQEANLTSPIASRMTANSAIPTNVSTVRSHKMELSSTTTLKETETDISELDSPQKKVINLHPKVAILQALGLMPISEDIYNNNETEPETNEKLIVLQCQECKEYFKTQTSLKKHCAEDHSIPLIYYCKFCTILFETRAELQAHKDEAHNGQKPYTCTMCPLSFISLDTLTAHVRRHNGKAPYTCKICEKGFDLFKEYRKHKELHQLVKPTPVKNHEKKFACKICDRAFRKPCDLQRHIRVHTGEKPYACSVCGNRFQQAHNLTKHMIIHTKEKQYECDLCKKIFGRNDVLRRHMLTHSIHKPFECKECNLSFARNSQLLEHLKKHPHDDKPQVKPAETDSKVVMEIPEEDEAKYDVHIQETKQQKPKKAGRKRQIKEEVQAVESQVKRKRGRPKKSPGKA